MKQILRNLWKDESAQGATEYILILVVVVAVAILFGGKFKGYINDALTTLQGKINDALKV